MAVKTKIQHRRDTAANWTSTNPTLAAGEIGFETDTQKFKIGTGSTAWASLGYQAQAAVTSITASSPLTGGTITSTGTIGINASSNTTANYVVQRNANGSFSANTVSAESFVKFLGTSDQFLKADGGVDGTQYVSQVYFINPPIGITTSTSLGGGIANISFSIDSGYALPLVTQLVPTGSIMMWATATAPDGWLICNAQSTTGYTALAALVGANVPDLRGKIPVGQLGASSLGTATITIATPGVITATGHGLSAGQQVYLTTDGGLPTGLTASTVYFVATVLSPNTLTLSTTQGGGEITTSGSQSGTHTLFTADFASLGQTGGELNHTLAVLELPSFTVTGGIGTTNAAHTHNVNNRPITSSSAGTPIFESWPSGTGTARTHTTTSNNTSHTHTFTADPIGGDARVYNIQPYIVLNYIIKT
jgi:microcystin-dependent protein